MHNGNKKNQNIIIFQSIMTNSGSYNYKKIFIRKNLTGHYWFKKAWRDQRGRTIFRKQTDQHVRMAR